MDRDDPIRALAEVAEWPRAPKGRLQIHAVEKRPDGGARDGTVLVVLLDVDVSRINLFFDNFAGRLCIGNGPKDPDAAFVQHGSELERELFVTLCTTDATPTQRAILGPAVAYASASTEIAFRTRVTLPADHAWDELDALILMNHKLGFLRLLQTMGLRDHGHQLDLLTDRYAYLRATRDAEFAGPHETYWKGFCT